MIAATHELVGLVSEETHKPAHEAIGADVLALAWSLRWHEKNVQRLLRTRRVRGAPFMLAPTRRRVSRAPLGRVAIMATWNYPVQLLGIQITQAICGGNDVVVKPSERTPRTQGRLVELLAADLPAGTLSITDAARDTGRLLLEHERFDHVVFTGSTAVGRKVASSLAHSLTASTLELSGRDSAFVLDDADARLAAQTIAWAVSTNGGQTCMAPRRALVMPDVYDAFVRYLRDAFTGLGAEAAD